MKDYYNNTQATAETITSGPRDYAQAPRLGPPDGEVLQHAEAIVPRIKAGR